MKPQVSSIIAAGLLGIPFLAGCGGSSGSSSAPLITPQPRSVSAKSANGLTVTLNESADAASQTGSVTYTVSLTNPTAQPVTIQLATCSGFDTPNPNYPKNTLTVTNAAGTQIYPAITLQPVPPCIPGPPVMQTIAPGQTLTDQKKLSINSLAAMLTAKGVYTLNAFVVTSSVGTASSVTIAGPLTLTVQ